MQLQKRILLLVASMSVGGFVFAGCTQERQFTAETTEPTANVQGQESTTVQAQEPASDLQTPEAQPRVPYVPTPNEVVVAMLELANVKGDDVLYDLGSGDGRIVITAAQKYGTRGTGIELRPELVEQSRENAKKAGVSDHTQFLQQDIFKTDLSDATVVTLYLLPDVNLQLRPKLFKELKPGTRIVSHDFDMGEWKPEKVVQVKSNPGRQHTLYYWVVPKEIPTNLR